MSNVCVEKFVGADISSFRVEVVLEAVNEFT